MPRSLSRPAVARRRPGYRSQAAEVLEDRALLAVTLLVDYSQDTQGFFNNPVARQAMESVAAELGSRLTTQLPKLERGTYLITSPRTFTETFVEFDAPANTLRVFAAGADSSISGSVLGRGGSRYSPAIRRFGFDSANIPYVSFIGFGGQWNWDFDGRNTSPDAIDFRAVARHELLHSLGIGLANSWFANVSSSPFGSGAVFNGTKVRAVNGGSPGVVSGHFEQGTFSLMQPFLSDILRPTAVDWAALDDMAWDVQLPGRYADVFARSADGTWWASANARGLSNTYEFGKWADDVIAGWRDVGTSVDLNGDGFTDVVGRTSGGTWYAGINTSNGFANREFGRWNEASFFPEDALFSDDVEFGDFNGDGKTDVVGRSVDGGLWVGISTGTTFQTSRWGVLPPAAIWQDLQVADFDGDGQDDVAFRNGAGHWYVGIANVQGDGFKVSYWGSWADSGSGAFWRDVQAVDMNSDGAADLIGRTHTGEWYVGLSRPRNDAIAVDVGSFSTFRWTRWNEAAGWRDVKVGDFSGDGYTDILGRTASGQFYVAQNVGGVQLSNIAFGRWTETKNGQNLWQTVLSGDFTGGERPDILARAADGSWWLGTNNGQKLTFSAYGQWGEALGWRDVNSTKKLVPAATPFDGNPDSPPAAFFTSGPTSVSAANLKRNAGNFLCGCAACMGTASTSSAALQTAGGSAALLLAPPSASSTPGVASGTAAVAFAPLSPRAGTVSNLSKPSVQREEQAVVAAPACPFEAARGALEATLGDAGLLGALVTA